MTEMRRVCPESGAKQRLDFSVNPRPAGPLDFPPPAGGRGGGRSNAPPLSRLLVVVEKNERRRSKAREKSFRNDFGNFFAQVIIEITMGQNSKKNPERGFDDKILNFKGRATILVSSCLSR